jgi:hypothetical protein
MLRNRDVLPLFRGPRRSGPNRLRFTDLRRLEMFVTLTSVTERGCPHPPHHLRPLPWTGRGDRRSDAVIASARSRKRCPHPPRRLRPLPWNGRGVSTGRKSSLTSLAERACEAHAIWFWLYVCSSFSSWPLMSVRLFARAARQARWAGRCRRWLRLYSWTSSS